MKTLDEVINIMEGVGLIDWGADALHYLKAYKEDRNDLTALRAYWKEQHENNALTWDELKQMEGKPVWVEPVKEWMLITEIEKCEGADRVWLLSLDGLDYEMGCHADWQAYRKEQE